jgi:phosphoribosylformylglycinamidine synthase I
MHPKVLILYAQGTNRECDAKQAFELAGAKPEIVHINQLRKGEKHWKDYQILTIPGGFSYADTLGAGHLFALDILQYFQDEVHEFITSGKPVIGICNGFQTLVKAGLLPQFSLQQSSKATLTFNENGQFECRWVKLKSQSQKCLWTRDLTEEIYCPVAHGEGRFLLENPADLESLISADQIALKYADHVYPNNPNGSIADIAGVCNVKGNVLGLMPHPENHIYSYQHPSWTRGEQGNLGLALFKNGVEFVK